MLPAGNTLHDLFDYANEKWAEISDEQEKEAMKIILAEDLFSINKSQARELEETRFTESQILTWMNAVKRIAANEPLQYVTGKAYFHGLLFDVDSSVLIPRPETEELVELVLNSFPEKSIIHAIDFCTGSGCIPIALKKKRKTWHITASDISLDALRVAMKNADKHNTKIKFFKGDLLLEHGIPEQKWDVIISNPPYIAQREKIDMAENVLQYEPHLALFVDDDDPVKFYRRIAEVASKKLNRKGKVFLELNPLYAEECASLFRDQCFDVQLHSDLSGKIRFLECTENARGLRV